MTFSGSPRNDFNQYLAAHLLGPGLIDLGGRLSPGSIRDQLVRATLVTDALLKHGYLRPDQQILVIGAGAAGLVSALHAAAQGINVWLVDAENSPLSRMRRNTRRTISPSLYDWPHSHWIHTIYEGSPLPYFETTPAKLAANWTDLLNGALHSRNSKLRWVPNMSCTLTKLDGPPWTAAFSPTDETGYVSAELTSKHFDVVYVCTGAGAVLEEPLPWKSSHGSSFPLFKFWDDDPFPGRNQDMQQLTEVADTESGEAARVVIVGAGDGGLQDLLRFLTGGLDARAILEPIVRAVQGHRDAYRTMYRLLDSDNRTSRHFACWEPAAARSQNLLDGSQLDFTRAVEELYLGNRDRHDALNSVLKELIIFNDILLFHRWHSLGPCYALNRFLAVLIDQFLRLHGPHKSPFRFGWTGKQVECLPDHDVSSDKPSRHSLGRHLITFADENGNLKPVSCRTVVARIGIARNNSRDIRQMLPFWLPAWGPPAKTTPRYGTRSTSLALLDDQMCRRALWRSLIGMAVMKNAEGRVFALNRRFANYVGKPASEIIGRKASEYGDPVWGVWVQNHDDRARTKLENLLAYSVSGGRPHFTFRFPHPTDSTGPGSASIGFDLSLLGVHQRVINDIDEPSPGPLERFFEWMPCSLSMTDRNHRFIYGNQAFRRLFTPPGYAALPSADLRDRTWEEAFARLHRDVKSEDPGDERKKSVWRDKSTAVWESHPPFKRGKRLVIGFPIFDYAGEVLALGSVGFCYEDVEKLIREANPYLAHSYSIDS